MRYFFPNHVISALAWLGAHFTVGEAVKCLPLQRASPPLGRQPFPANKGGAPSIPRHWGPICPRRPPCSLLRGGPWSPEH